MDVTQGATIHVAVLSILGNWVLLDKQVMAMAVALKWNDGRSLQLIPDADGSNRLPLMFQA